ncbi:MAG: hypothetical protein ACRD1K_10340 [Acidimicrobiales bacterium]
MKPPDCCDVCGIDVPPDEGVRTEVSKEGAMCPTAMVFHDSCYVKAREFWDVDTDSACPVDPDFPETPTWEIPVADARS